MSKRHGPLSRAYAIVQAGMPIAPEHEGAQIFRGQPHWSMLKSAARLNYRPAAKPAFRQAFI